MFYWTIFPSWGILFFVTYFLPQINLCDTVHLFIGLKSQNWMGVIFQGIVFQLTVNEIALFVVIFSDVVTNLRDCVYHKEQGREFPSRFLDILLLKRYMLNRYRWVIWGYTFEGMYMEWEVKWALGKITMNKARWNSSWAISNPKRWCF